MVKGRSAQADPRESARVRLKKETGYVRKDFGGRLSVALVYPNAYGVGMSNLGFHKIYSLLNRHDDVVCERAFLPSADEVEFLKKNRRPAASLESGRPLKDFDIVAFSITFEADYINVLAMLDLAGIPFHERGQRDPLVMAGGISVTLNPEVMAPFLDVVAIGEAEGIIDPLVDAFRKAEGGRPAMEELAKIPGLYVPSAYTPVFGDDGRIERVDVADGFPSRVLRAWDKGYGRSPNVSVIDTPDTVFGDMALVEIGKGCGRHCRFCAAGYAYRPTRHADTEAVVAAINSALERKGKVGLVSSAIGDHPDVEKIFEHIVENGGEFSVSSLRLDRLTDSMLANLAKGKCHTITLAPEAGTERLRRAVNKNISDATIIDTAVRISRMGDFRLKLYFLVGLPGETDEDVAGIADLVRRIKDAMAPEYKKRGKTPYITVGVDGFIPKAFTPFQWAPFGGIKPVDEKIKSVTRALRAMPNVAVQSGSARQSYIQAVLSMGDRRIGAVLEKAYDLGGDWFRAFRESDIDPDFFATHPKSEDEIAPWGIIDHGLREDYLKRDYDRSMKGKTIAECPPPGGECSRCGDFKGVCTHAERA